MALSYAHALVGCEPRIPDVADQPLHPVTAVRPNNIISLSAYIGYAVNARLVRQVPTVTQTALTTASWAHVQLLAVSLPRAPGWPLPP